MADAINAAVVLAALDNILEPMGTHRGTHLSIMRLRVQRLRDQVAQHATPTTETEEQNNG